MIKVDTKELLANSIKELLRENSFTEICVRDIVKNCGVSSTILVKEGEEEFACTS